MLAQSAKHETVSARPAASILGGGKGKGKKAAGLAGLFSEILSQAQKGLGIKAPDGAKAASKAKGPDRASPLPPSAARASAKTEEKGKGLQPRPATPSTPVAERVLARADARASDQAQAQAQAPKPKDKRQSGRPEDSAKPESKPGKTVEDKRRAKPPSEAANYADTASRAALSSPKSTIAAAPKAKALRESGDADASVGAVENKRDRGASEPRLTVLDMRRSVESRREASAKVEVSAKSDDASKDALREIKSSGHGSGHELVHDLAFDARAAGDASSSWKADSSAASARGADFQSMLAERMKDAWNGEIVKSAHIVLKDGDAGTIRLRLKPESLGNVKIELNLSDNNISGRIVVESDEAKSAFERNMNQLTDAFRQGGFDSARLEVAVGGGSGGGASGSGAGSGDSSGPFYSERLRSAVASTADPATAVSAYARRGGAVDILA